VQRVPEPQSAALDRRHRCGREDGTVQRDAVESGRPGDDVQPRVVGQGGGDEKLPGRRRQPPDRGGDQSLEGGGARGHSGVAANGQLEGVHRVAPGGLHHAPEVAPAESPAETGAHQVEDCGLRQRPELDVGASLTGGPRGVAGQRTGGDEHGDGRVTRTVQRVRQHQPAAVVGPVRVVQDDEHPPGGGCRREDRAQRCRDEPLVGVLARRREVEAECVPERGVLRGRQLGTVEVRDPLEQVGENAERQPLLRLTRTGEQHPSPEVGGPPQCGTDQRGLAAAWRTGDHQDPQPLVGVGAQQVGHGGELALAAHDRDIALLGHARRLRAGASASGWLP
jgi:hypothetical protein